jgi:hypothetical protein
MYKSYWTHLHLGGKFCLDLPLTEQTVVLETCPKYLKFSTVNSDEPLSKRFSKSTIYVFSSFGEDVTSIVIIYYLYLI